MRKRKLLSKALSVLLSGTMLAGMIPALSVTAGAKAYGFHTLDGYLSEWSYSFEKGFNGTSWKSEDKDEDTHGWDVVETTALAHCGGKFMRSQSQTDSDEPLNPDNWLYSPLIELSGDKEYQLTFNAFGKNNTFGVYIAVGRYSTNYVQIGSDYTISDTEWNEYTIDLSEYAGKYIHLAFVHHKSSSTQDLFLDCVDISGRPKGYTLTRSWGFEDTVFEDEEWGVADVPKSFIAADKDKDGDTWEVIKADWYAHSGECSVRARGSADVMDNWLRLPQLWLDNDKDYLLTFYVSDSFAYQTVDVYLYGSLCHDGNVTPEDLDGDEIPEYFSKVLIEDIAIVGKVSGWHEVKVDLSDYAGQYVYAAIVQHGGEGEMRVDDIALWQRDAHTPDGDRTNVYFEGFENEDGELPSGWGNFDEDGDGNNWNAYYGGFEKRHHGKGYVYSESYKGGAITPDNWLVMPSYKVSTTKITTLTFEAVGSHYEDYNEVFGVFISVDGGEYEQIGKDYTTSYVWQEVEVDLTPYAGKSVRVAVVHHNCTNQESLLLDCFNIWEEPFPPIETADVTVDRPMVGETVPTTTAEAIKINIDSYDISARAYAFQWKKTSKESYETEETPKYTSVTHGETFSVDYVYRLVARFTLDECYTFADKLQMTVNGIAKYYDAEYEIKGDGNILDVSIIFYPLEAYITDVAVTVTEPVVGAVPDIAPTVVTTPDKTFEYFAAWAKALKEDYTTLTETDWEPIDSPTETFAEGYVYTVCFGMGTYALPQYEFSPDVTATINGKPALKILESYCYNPSELYAYAVFDLSSTKPQNVKATPGDGKVTLTWDKVDGATKYAVYYSKDGSSYTLASANVTETSYTVTGLTNGTKYFFKVKAAAGGTWSEMSDAVSATPVAAISVPTNLKATAGNGQVTVSWTASAGATKYAVYYSKDGSTYTLASANVTATSYTVTGLTNGTKYLFKVKAAGNGVWSGLSNYVAATPVGTMSAPTNLKATAGNGQVTVSWTAPAGASKYAVYYSKDGSTYTLASASVTATSYTVTGLTNGTKYLFKAKAYGNGVWSGLSNYVAETPVGTISAPTNLKATAGNGKVTVSWTAPAGATKYAVYYSKDGSTYTLASASVTATSYTVTGLTNGTKYLFKVKAAGNGVWSGLSNYVAATPVGTMSAPTNLKATAGNGQVTVSWTAPAGATKYAVYYSKDASTYTLASANVTATSYTVTGLTNGTRYLFKVKAAGNGVWSGLSNYVAATPTA